MDLQMKTIKELEAYSEKPSEIAQGAIRALKDVLKLIDEIDCKGDEYWKEELKARIEGK